MKVLIQRVSAARVEVEGELCGQIGRGILALVGLEPGDGQPQLEKMLHKLLNYRIFPDSEGRMNCSVQDVQGGLLLVSQFTLAADTRSGLRPGFSTAAAPQLAEQLFAQFVGMARDAWPEVATGRFGADMQVSLTNDGPVTFLLQV
ncbi:MAG: D-tyrosyl-tRNA(Tyr) deacylase [Gammaproteobacteria bacterium]|nr:D-tyrosyl-tRNA(Tyr) deacylase [Gammaproteobacteria bacterium]